ncbi:MAG: hypothetical protein NZ901_05840 [Geminocystis sp.]|nr:hypothetical protein [Geminocystis sp.]MDW8117347.1 hypothetical protein [Geminocystis sp.]
MSTNTMSPSIYSGIAGDEQYLYEHLLECVKTQSPERVLDRFRHLFIIAKSYDSQKVLESLARIISKKQAAEYFPSILNRCCYILVNRWQLQPQTQRFVVELVELFDRLPAGVGVGSSYARTYSGRMIQLVRHFLTTDYYRQLKRLATIIGEGLERKNNSNSQREETIGQLITRYPYLYEHCLLSPDSDREQQQTVYQLRREMERKFENQLSKFVIQQVRLAQGRLEINKERLIKSAVNPTLLSDKDLNKSLKHFVGPVERGYSYQQLSSSFLSYTSDVRNYQMFKDSLYEYIVQSIDENYGKHSFNRKLYERIQQIYPQHNNTKPDEFLKMRTYSQLFNYLVVESPQNPNHLVFMDMISNMGTTKTIGLLLKIVLLCSKVKPYLEKRFSILFNHYESFTRDGAAWLVRSLEKLNVAFTVHFGNLDISFLRRIYAGGFCF